LRVRIGVMAMPRVGGNRFDHGPKRRHGHWWRGQARQSCVGAEGSPDWWRRISDWKVGVLHALSGGIVSRETSNPL